MRGHVRARPSFGRIPRSTAGGVATRSPAKSSPQNASMAAFTRSELSISASADCGPAFVERHAIVPAKPLLKGFARTKVSSIDDAPSTPFSVREGPP